MITDKIVIDSSIAIKWFIAQDYSLYYSLSLKLTS